MLQGLTVEIETFHGTDARVYQLPTILQLSERLDFSDYPSAQTPLYHVLTAWWGELVGFELWKLRLLNVLFSYGMALALLRLLRRATPLESWQAFALTLLFVLSPYVLGDLLHAAHGQPRAPVRARGPRAHPCVLARRRSRRLRGRLCRDRGGAADASGLRLARAGRGRLPAARRPACARPAARGRRHARPLARAARPPCARVERARPAQRRPGLVRPMRGPPGPRARGAHAAHSRLHGRARRGLRRARLRPGPPAPAAAACARRCSRAPMSASAGGRTPCVGASPWPSAPACSCS